MALTEKEYACADIKLNDMQFSTCKYSLARIEAQTDDKLHIHPVEA